MGKSEEKLKWWQLSLLGVACTIGTGFFLGSGIALKIGGPSAIISFILAAFGTYFVFDVLSKMTVDDPQKGSFRSYAKKAFGRWAGFSSGWVYWCSELLISGSQMTALAIFSRFWFPDVPMWIFSTGYAIAGLTVIIIGTKGFESLEDLFAILKIAAIVMFIGIAAAAIAGLIDGGKNPIHFPHTIDTFFTTGATGLWASLIFAFYAYGGIEIMGLMAIRLQEPKKAPVAGKVMILTLAFVYVLSLGLAISMVSWHKFSSKESPFVIALDNYHLSFVPHVFNAVLIIAGFSTMVASLYAVTKMVDTLAGDGDAPGFFSKKWPGKVPLPAIGLTTSGLVISIVVALLMPDRIYEYITTAAGLMLLYNWFVILASARRLLKLTKWDTVKCFSGMGLILLAISGTLFHESSRPGLYVSLAFIAVIGALTLVMSRVWRRQQG